MAKTIPKHRHAEVIASEVKESILLDKKDREIINVLTLNSRTPLSQIANALNTSTEVATYHYNQLRAKHIITDVFSIINVNALGVKRYCIYLQFHSLSQQKMKGIIAEFLNNKHISWVIETGGKWEIILMIETLYQDKYDTILDSIISKNQDYLNDYMVVTVRNFIHKSPRFIRNMKRIEEYHGVIRFPYQHELDVTRKREMNKKEKTKEKADQTYNIDEKDIRLLKLIHEDSRLSLTELGRMLDLSKDAISYRLKNLIASDIITSFIIRLNYHLLGYQYTTIMLKLRGTSQERKQEFFNFVYEDERFYCLMEQIGAWDISLMMFFTDAKDLRDFIILIKEKFSDVISSHESVIHFNQHYFTYLCDGVVEELMEKHRKKK